MCNFLVWHGGSNTFNVSSKCNNAYLGHTHLISCEIYTYNEIDIIYFWALLNDLKYTRSYVSTASSITDTVVAQRASTRRTVRKHNRKLMEFRN